MLSPCSFMAQSLQPPCPFGVKGNPAILSIFLCISACTTSLFCDMVSIQLIWIMQTAGNSYFLQPLWSSFVVCMHFLVLYIFIYQITGNPQKLIMSIPSIQLLNCFGKQSSRWEISSTTVPGWCDVRSPFIIKNWNNFGIYLTELWSKQYFVVNQKAS